MRTREFVIEPSAINHFGLWLSAGIQLTGKKKRKRRREKKEKRNRKGAKIATRRQLNLAPASIALAQIDH